MNCEFILNLMNALNKMRRFCTLAICKGKLISKDKQSPSLLSRPKIHKDYFEASNQKMLLPILKSDCKVGHFSNIHLKVVFVNFWSI